MLKTLKVRVADRIRQILLEKGIKQKDLPESTGYSESYISLIMSGNINLTIESIDALEKALKSPIVTIEILLASSLRGK